MNANSYVYTDDVLESRNRDSPSTRSGCRSRLEVEKALYALEERRMAMLECYLQRLEAAGEQETIFMPQLC